MLSVHGTSTATILQVYTTGGATTYTMDNVGEVSIGSDQTPENLLDIHSASAQAALAITSLGADTDPFIKFELADATPSWVMGIDDSDGDKFKISSSTALGTNDRFVIDGGGKVGINDATPDAFFDIDTPSTLTSGTIFATAAPSATTLTAALVGAQLNLNTNYTATGLNVTGYDAALPAVTNTGTGNYKFRAFRTNSNGALVHNTGAGVTTFDGFYVANPNITQTTGTVSASGFTVANGTITTGGTQTGLSVVATGVGAGTLYGVDIGAITGGAGTETAVNIGAGWDTGILSASSLSLSGSAANILLGSNWLSGDGADEGVFVDTSGDVGIGTNDPDSLAAFFAVRKDQNAATIQKIWNGTTGASAASRLDLVTATTNSYVINGMYDNSASPYYQLAAGSGVVNSYFNMPAYNFQSTGGTNWLNIDTAGEVGIGVNDPDRRLEVFDTVAQAQLKLSYDASTYSQFQTNSSGDLTIDASGGDANLLDENFWVCSGGACPSGTPTGNGNLIVERGIGVATSTPITGISVGADSAIVTTEKNVSDAGTITIDWNQGNQQLIRLAASRTVNFSNVKVGQTLRLVVCRTAGSYTATWGSTIRWGGGAAPTQTTTSNKCDVFSFIGTLSDTGSAVIIFGSSSLNF
jgi:hypothetical protein